MSFTPYLQILCLLPLIPIISLTIQQKSFMMMLLSLEALILTLVLATGMFMGASMMNEPYICFILLVFGACEASLGLSIMVTILRSYGNENTMLLTLSKC